jgi:hypothetical protein
LCWFLSRSAPESGMRPFLHPLPSLHLFTNTRAVAAQAVHRCAVQVCVCVWVCVCVCVCVCWCARACNFM